MVDGILRPQLVELGEITSLFSLCLLSFLSVALGEAVSSKIGPERDFRHEIVDNLDLPPSPFVFPTSFSGLQTGPR